MKFVVKSGCENTDARTGILETEHGTIPTPIFMPVGTQATVKYLNQAELQRAGAEIILGNTFHLYLRPGHDLIESAGGIHQFMNWKKPTLTDSGGYQVYSLSAMRKITEEGVRFRSHIDGSSHFFSPEYAIEIQKSIGADIIMAFDECTPYPCEYSYAETSMHRTHRWLDRCLDYFDGAPSKMPYMQSLAPIVQGSTYISLRKESAKYIAEKGAEVNAIGGLSVGEPAPIMYEMTDEVCQILPRNKARYLMGVGTPANILECISRGVDMFDCVMPTRNARHGLLYTSQGQINIKNSRWRDDFSPIDEHSSSEMSKAYSKAYLRHLFNVKEALGPQIASVHNISFYMWLVRQARLKILSGEFEEWKKSILPRLEKKL